MDIEEKRYLQEIQDQPKGALTGVYFSTKPKGGYSCNVIHFIDEPIIYLAVEYSYPDGSTSTITQQIFPNSARYYSAGMGKSKVNQLKREISGEVFKF